ncbi:transposase, partial [Tateyamaria sp.]|uniref:transposase n=1 Tax=Tateyamaria sp. TaxID=1929288 RepID=UPI0039B8EE81
MDAEAIVEAALRPSMSFVAVKTKEQQAQAVMFRSRDLYLRQTAVAIQAFCPAADNFDSGRGFAAWLGLVPRQNSTGGKDRFGRITKMGQRDVRRLLVTGAMSVISASERKGRCDDPWLANMLKKKPRLVA